MNIPGFKFGVMLGYLEVFGCVSNYRNSLSGRGPSSICLKLTLLYFSLYFCLDGTA